MGLAVLRLAHRRTVDEATSVKRIVELLFLDDDDDVDPSLSVYTMDIDGRTVTQIISEHSAFAEIDPPARSAVNIGDLVDLPISFDDDGGFFSFRRLTHCVVTTEKDLEFYTSLAESLLRSKVGRFWSASASQIKEYGKREYNSGNVEWLASANACAKVMQWASKIPDLQKNIEATLH